MKTSQQESRLAPLLAGLARHREEEDLTLQQLRDELCKFLPEDHRPQVPVVHSWLAGKYSPKGEHALAIQAMLAERNKPKHKTKK